MSDDSGVCNSIKERHQRKTVITLRPLYVWIRYPNGIHPRINPLLIQVFRVFLVHYCSVSFAEFVIYVGPFKAAKEVFTALAPRWWYVSMWHGKHWNGLIHLVAKLPFLLLTCMRQKIGLLFKATLDNVTNVRPVGTDFRWYLKVMNMLMLGEYRNSVSCIKK